MHTHEHTNDCAMCGSQMIAPVSIGQIVPDIKFKIYHENKEKETSLHAYHGKWLILFFYPADFTFVCPTELEEMADNYEAFKAEGAEIVSMSTDTVFTHKAWHDTSPAIKKITFPMGADRTGVISKTFGTYIEAEGDSLRGTFIINPEGELKTIEINHNDIGRSAKELLRKVKAAKYVLEHPGNVCPASWEPGDDTLKPGMDLVGKI